MFKASALALLVSTALPLFAVAGDAASTQQIMKEYKSSIQNQIADIDYKRKQIVEAAMVLDAKEGEAFWPVYNSYRTEADKLSKGAIALLLDYAKAYNANSIDDATAAKLQEQLLDLQEDRQELKEKYAQRVAKEVSSKRSLRWLQIEDQLDAISLLANTREVPLVE
ncbi:transcriptional regulator [Pseudomonas cavernae]|uniref:Transcriptional regulator n=1 Tax=Pseudomonas cavernae TaxID=2320867 RepID=A0A385YZP4_9PSED|nr:transcriptional regulator [Pseudomonas cavernae]AYC31053.1 transcriptional regulator [Pseudomonas cavernae]